MKYHERARGCAVPGVNRGSRVQRGMTLIEVLAAAGMFVVIFSAISGLIWSTRRLQSSVEERETALFHLEGVAERISSTAFASIPITFPGPATSPPDVSAATGVVRTLPNESITVSYPGWSDPDYPTWDSWDDWDAGGQPQDGIPDPLTIRIRVTWIDTEGGAPQTETLVIVRSNSV